MNVCMSYQKENATITEHGSFFTESLYRCWQNVFDANFFALIKQYIYYMHIIYIIREAGSDAIHCYLLLPKSRNAFLVKSEEVKILNALARGG